MVFLLNTGKLHIIFQSQRKTDKVDAVKIARYVRDTHEDSICSMNIPTKGESEIRQIVNSYNFARKQRTQLINKLHSIFNMNGYPEVKKSDLERNESRLSVITDKLEGLVCQDATMVEELVTSVELRIEKYIDIMRQYILDNPEVALPWLSLPGIGLISCASILAYIGDGSRFYSPKQLRNYVGLVPRIDQSGDHCWQGGLSSYGCMQA